MSHRRAKKIRKAINFDKKQADQVDKRFYRRLKDLTKEVPSEYLNSFCRQALKEFNNYRAKNQKKDLTNNKYVVK